MRFLPVVTLCAALLGGNALAADKASAKKAKTVEVKIEKLVLQIPTAWKQVKPTSTMRKGQFSIPAVKGDKHSVDYLIYSFAGGGGGPIPNILRWVKQFQSSGRGYKIFTGTAPQGEYYVLDISGTWNKPIGPPIRRQTKPLKNARMIGVILQLKSNRQTFFIKVPGEAKTVTANLDAIRKSFGGVAAKEMKTEIPSGDSNNK